MIDFKDLLAEENYTDAPSNVSFHKGEDWILMYLSVQLLHLKVCWFMTF